MRMEFEKPLTDEDKLLLAEYMQDSLVALDNKIVLSNRTRNCDPVISEIASIIKQVPNVYSETHGDITELSDGRRYQVTPTGWKRIVLFQRLS